MKNKIWIVGMGPGNEEMMTGRAIEVLEQVDVIIGYTVYLDLLGERFQDKEFLSTPMRQEEKRCRMCFEEAEKGKSVAMVCSGDSGIYGMAGLIYEIGRDYPEIGIEIVPGITAASGGAAVLGAPLMHDFAVISLSDLMTPLDLIMKRVDCAGQGDMIVCLYNPKSKKRVDYVEKAADILMKYRKAETPVGIVRNAGRKDESHCITTLGALKDADIDMFSVVIIGNSQTYEKNGRMITPRGYRL